MDKAFLNTILYWGLFATLGIAGYLVKRFVKGIDRAVEKLSDSVDLLVKLVRDHEKNHAVFDLRLEFHNDKISNHEERIGELETKVK